MRYRVLGPLEVCNEHHSLALGEGGQRTVLILLLLHRNEAVSTDLLIDALWGDAPPATAAKVLQNHVSQLRRALEDREGRRLLTRGRGYLLAVEDGELDLDRFERLVDEGSGALASDRPADAARSLREALALWRGPPLADVAYEAFAQAEIARLEERHLAALEQRIDADLALGRHADLVAELEGLVAEHPLRERMRAQLMVALYRCGRQADALETYGDARRALLDKLGVEPGPALRELQAAILRQAPELAPVAAIRGRGPRALPAAESLCWRSAASCWPARPSRRPARSRRASSGRCAPRRERRRRARPRERVGDSTPSTSARRPRVSRSAGEPSGSPTPTATASRASTWTTTQCARPSPSGTAPPASRSPTGSGLGRQQPRWHRLTGRREHEQGRADASPSEPTRPASPRARGAVWVANAGEQTISRIDPRTGGPDQARRGCRAHRAGRRRRRGLDDELERTHGLADRPAFGTRAADGPGGRRRERHRRHRRRGLGRQQPRRHRLADRSGDRARRRDDPGRQRAGLDRRCAGRRVGRRASSGATSIASTPRQNRVVDRIALGHHPTGLAVADGALWVGTRASGTEHRGGTLRVLAPSAVFDVLDHALAYSPGSRRDRRTDRRRPHRLSARGRPRRHADRARPGGHAATSREDGGRTYRFVLRPRNPLLDRRRGARPRRPTLVRASVEDPSVRGFHVARDRLLRHDRGRRTVHARALDSATCRAASSPSRATTRWSRSISLARTLSSSTSSRQLRVHPARRGHRRVPPTAPGARDRAVRGGATTGSSGARPDPQPAVSRVVAGRTARRLCRPDRGATSTSRCRARSTWSFAADADTVLAGVDPARARELVTQHASQTHVEPERTHRALVQHPYAALRRRARAPCPQLRDRPPRRVRAVGGGAVAGADVPDPAAQLPRLRPLLPVRRSGPPHRAAPRRRVGHCGHARRRADAADLQGARAGCASRC